MQRFAIVVSPSPPNPPAPSPGCAYQVQIGYSPNTFRCYTTEEYDTLQAQEKANSDAAWKTSKDFISDYWGWMLIGIVGFFVLAGILAEVVEKIDRKRNPWKYDKRTGEKFKFWMV